MVGEEIYSEKLLIKELIAGNEKAFRRLYDAYCNDIYAYSLCLLKSEAYAEEILQDVFLKVWIKREGLDASLSFKSYLFTIARNMAFNFLKKAANDVKLREEIFYRSQKSYNPTDQKIREADLENIKREAIALLPPRRRLIFEMSRNDGKSYEDIGKELGISISTVKSQMNKALKTIHDFLLDNRELTLSIMILLAAWAK